MLQERDGGLAQLAGDQASPLYLHLAFVDDVLHDRGVGGWPTNPAALHLAHQAGIGESLGRGGLLLQDLAAVDLQDLAWLQRRGGV